MVCQVLQDTDVECKRCPNLTKLVVLCNVCCVKFLPKCIAEVPEAQTNTFQAPYPGFFGYGGEPPPLKKIFPALENHLFAKFHCNLFSSKVLIFIEKIQTQTHIDLYLLEDGRPPTLYQ